MVHYSLDGLLSLSSHPVGFPQEERKVDEEEERKLIPT